MLNSLCAIAGRGLVYIGIGLVVEGMFALHGTGYYPLSGKYDYGENHFLRGAVELCIGIMCFLLTAVCSKRNN